MFKKINKMDKLTEIFLKNGEKEFHLRELSRMTKQSPATILKYLKELNFIISKKERNLSLFKANTDSEIFKELKIRYNLDLLNTSKILDHLIFKFNQPETIILFGSFGRGEDSEMSDIDLAVITPIKKSLDLSKFEKKLNRNISLHLFSKNRIENMKKNNKELLNNLINGKILRGYWELFR
jgi:predicted nucleotidyltransferase